MSDHHHTHCHPIHHANTTNPFGELAAGEFYRRHNILHHDSFLNHHNVKIYTQSWRPATSSSPPLALIAMVHGYSAESGWIFATTAAAAARHNFVVYSLDLRGHGRSDGRRGCVPDVAPLVEDCVQYFDSVLAANPNLPAFIYGESLGGAIALLVSLRQRGRWNGLVLNGAMCGVSRKVKPPWPLELLLPAAAFVLPNWRLDMFTKSLVTKSYKLKWKRELVRNNPRASPEHPTTATALELLRVCMEVYRRCCELKLPLLVLHGDKDAVCDVDSAKKVYKMAGSKDKTLKIIDGMWHQLIGERVETVEEGFGVIFSWIKERAKGKGSCC